MSPQFELDRAAERKEEQRKRVEARRAHLMRTDLEELRRLLQVWREARAIGENPDEDMPPDHDLILIPEVLKSRGETIAT